MERLASLEKAMEMFMVSNAKDHAELKELLTKYGENIYGNGKPGLLTRMASLESIAEYRKWAIGIISIFVGALISIKVWELFRQ